jgi:hypothetical protein
LADRPRRYLKYCRFQERRPKTGFDPHCGARVAVILYPFASACFRQFSAYFYKRYPRSLGMESRNFIGGSNNGNDDIEKSRMLQALS